MQNTATTGVLRGKKARTMPRRLYCRRKEGPQCEIQCASSIKSVYMRDENSLFRRTFFMNRSVSNISGDINTILNFPATMSLRGSASD